MKIRIGALAFMGALLLANCSDVPSPTPTTDSWSTDLTTNVDTNQIDTTVMAPDLGPAPDTAPNPTPDNGVSPTPDPTPDPTPTEYGIRYIRIHTNDSPSWIAWSEIQVWGAPVSQPGVSMNLALNKPVTADKTEANSKTNYAVDGDTSTSWNAGDFAPATLTIDLETVATIENIRLLVAQQPAGATTHVVSFGDADGNYEQAHIFSASTENSQWLEFVPSTTPTPDPDPNLDPDPTPGPSPVGNLPRGISWVRNNPMFISGLSVSTDFPTQAQVNTYYNEFNATAAHFWNDGITDALTGWEAANHPKSRWLSWVRDNGTAFNNQVIGGLGANHPGRIGYQVGDEPGLHGNGMEELMALDVGVNAVRAADPDALIIINFSFWAEDFLELLEYFGAEMDADIYCYDRYSLGYNEHETLAQVRAAALKHNRPYWRYLKSYHDVGKSNDQHPSDYRWSAFLGLVYGYTGHTWFVYQANTPHAVASDLFPSQGGFGQQELEPFHIVAELNQQMAHLGRAITQLTSTDVRYVAGQSLYLRDGLVNSEPGAGNDPHLSNIDVQENSLFDVRDLAVGFFADDAGETYVMIQNQQHKGAQFPIDNLKESTVELTFDFSGAPANIDQTKVLMLDHVTGNQMELPLQDLGNSTRKLVHSLAAGDPLFIKYATGNPFPLGPAF